MRFATSRLKVISKNMAHLLFEIGRYSAFLGVFSFALFGLNLWMFRSRLNTLGLSLSDDESIGGEEVRNGGAGMSDTVHYLRRRDYETTTESLQSLGGQYRNRIVWPFFLGVWSFCLGLALMSVTLGFVLFD